MASSNSHLRLVLALLFGTASLFATVEIRRTEFGKKLNRFFLEQLFRYRGPLKPSGDVVLVALDEPSYENLRTPENGISFQRAWPRAMHGKLLERLAEAGAKRAIFDILFLGKGDDPNGDQAFAKGISALPVVLGAEHVVEDTQYGKFCKFNLAFQQFDLAAETSAIVHLPHIDGRVRNFYSRPSGCQEAMIKAEDFPTLSEAALGDVWKTATRPRYHDLINYYGPAGTIPTYPYWRILDDLEPVPDEALRDKIVYVGLAMRTETGPAQKDAFLTPYSDRQVFGVEIHATAADNLLTDRWMRTLEPMESEQIWAFVQLVLVSALAAARPLLGIGLLSISLTAWIIFAVSSFSSFLFIGGAIPMLLMAPGTLTASALYFYFVTRRQERLLQGAFEHYVSPQMVKKLANQGVDLGLGGEEVEGTAFFSDIVNFSDITDGMPAPDVSEMLNAYFDEVAEAIFVEQGTLIKFIGDAVFAIWGAPLPNEEHASAAFQAALDMQQRVEAFNRRSRFPTLETRIGLHSGIMLAGNLGSSRRFDYTAVGDSVNIAARLEGLNKKFGTKILLSEDLVRRLDDTSSLLNLGMISVKGKKEPFAVYTIVPGDLPESRKHSWEALLQVLPSQEIDELREGLQGLASVTDVIGKSALLHLQFLELFEREGVKKNWNGELAFEK